MNIAAKARVVDVTHDVHSYDILEAAFLLESAYEYFPPGTVHVVVVDPGVGSARRPIAAAWKGYSFVAPDNGVLSFVLQPEAEVYAITNAGLFLNPVSSTFHGRDVFAPVAGHLARGLAIDSVGPRILDFVKAPLPKPHREGGRLVGTILRIDKFGNIITNLRREHLAGDFTVRIAGLSVSRLYSTFSSAGPDEFFAVEGSTGYIELALNQGSAANRLNVRQGAEIEVETGSVNH